MESELETLAFDRNVSKAGFIRRCLHVAIADARQGKTLEWPHWAECETAFPSQPCGGGPR
jgi:hypothetical protein